MFFIDARIGIKMNNAILTNKSITELLKKISQVLSVLSIEELSQAIGDILIKQDKKDSNLQTLINIVCTEYNVSNKSLFEKYSRDKIYSAKITLFVLMNKHLGMSKRKIAKYFRTYPNSVNVAIAHFDTINPERFKTDKDFLKKYKVCLSKFLETIYNE